MLEELRNHDPEPTEQELACMRTDLLRVVARVTALTVLALIISTAVSEFTTAKAPSVVATAR